MSTLYQKYRPKNFEEVVNQNHIKLTLSHEIETDKLAHAYLFSGPRAVGKTTLARVLAKAVNCLERKAGEYEPCSKCVNCQDIASGRNMDIIEVDGASHTGVDNVRENIIAQARVMPSRSKYKVFIIDEVHMLSISAFNALLKTLEEPPKNVIFILATTEIHKVPTTIISRCQRFDFKRISVVDIAKKLDYIAKQEGIKIEKKVLEAIARQSEGHMRDAESLLGQVISIAGSAEITFEQAELVIPRSDLGEVLKLIENLATKNAGEGLEVINKLINEGIDLKTFSNDLIEILRKIMFAKISPALVEKLGLEFGETVELKINEVSAKLNVNNLIFYIEEFNKARNELKTSFIQQMPLELAVIRICLGEVQRIAAPAQRPQNIGSPANTPISSQQASNAAARQAMPTTVKSVGHDEIMAKWNEVLTIVKKHNHSLSFILRVCKPKEINGNQLCLAFKYKFHKDRIDDVNIKQVVEKVLGEVYNTPLMITAVVDEGLDINSESIQEFANTATAPAAKAPEKVIKKTAAPESPKGQGHNSAIDDLLKTFGGRIVG